MKEPHNYLPRKKNNSKREKLGQVGAAEGHRHQRIEQLFVIIPFSIFFIQMNMLQKYKHTGTGTGNFKFQRFLFFNLGEANALKEPFRFLLNFFRSNSNNVSSLGMV